VTISFSARKETSRGVSGPTPVCAAAVVVAAAAAVVVVVAIGVSPRHRMALGAR